MLEIRKMELSEASEVRKVARKAFSVVENLFLTKPKEAMVAVLDGKIVGGIIIKYISCGINKIGYFDGAFIDPDYHGQGIGAQLYTSTTNYLWEQGCTALAAFVKDDNIASWKLFLNDGFSRVSFFEGVKKLGFMTMLKYYFTTPYFISNGMEFYLAIKDTDLQSKQMNTSKNILLYLLVNALLFLFGWIGSSKNYPIYLAAYLTLLTSGVLFSYIGTLFSNRKWYFRLNSGGAALCAIFNFLGGLFPMIGNWYPQKYENTKGFIKDMGVVSLIDWIALLCITATAFIFSDSHIYIEYVYILGEVLLIFKMIPIYPMESYGGGRLIRWNKWLYGMMSIASGAIILLGMR